MMSDGEDELDYYTDDEESRDLTAMKSYLENVHQKDIVSPEFEKRMSKSAKRKRTKEQHHRQRTEFAVWNRIKQQELNDKKIRRRQLEEMHKARAKNWAVTDKLRKHDKVELVPEQSIDSRRTIKDLNVGEKVQ
eukprot:UN31506